MNHWNNRQYMQTSDDSAWLHSLLEHSSVIWLIPIYKTKYFYKFIGIQLKRMEVDDLYAIWKGVGSVFILQTIKRYFKLKY
jgi:multidrug transporter EmrE-like cation transporter